MLTLKTSSTGPDWIFDLGEGNYAARIDLSGLSPGRYGITLEQGAHASLEDSLGVGLSNHQSGRRASRGASIYDGGAFHTRRHSFATKCESLAASKRTSRKDGRSRARLSGPRICFVCVRHRQIQRYFRSRARNTLLLSLQTRTYRGRSRSTGFLCGRFSFVQSSDLTLKEPENRVCKSCILCRLEPRFLEFRNSRRFPGDPS